MRWTDSSCKRNYDEIIGPHLDVDGTRNLSTLVVVVRSNQVFWSVVGDRRGFSLGKEIIIFRGNPISNRWQVIGR